MHGIMLSFLEVVELLKVILIQLRKPLHLILIILLEEIYNQQKVWAVGSDINKINALLMVIGLNFGLTNEGMNSCLKNNEVQDEILNERVEAQKKYKIDSTPTILVNEKKYNNKIDYKAFKKIIDKNL